LRSSRVNDVRLEACEPIHSGGLEHNWQVICHHVGVTTAGSDGDGITRQPLLGVGMAVVRLDPVDLDVCGRLHGTKPCCESSQAVSDNGGVISSLWSEGGCDVDSWSSGSAGSRSDDRPSSVAARQVRWCCQS
jgi:hypothetical protein